MAKENISKRRTVQFMLGKDLVTMQLKRFTKCTCVKCDHFPNADWRPYIDFGEKMTDCSLDGWELKTPEFPLIDAMAQAMIFEFKGWTDDKNYESVDSVLEQIKTFNEKNAKKEA